MLRIIELFRGCILLLIFRELFKNVRKYWKVWFGYWSDFNGLGWDNGFW